MFERPPALPPCGTTPAARRAFITHFALALAPLGLAGCGMFGRKPPPAPPPPPPPAPGAPPAPPVAPPATAATRPAQPVPASGTISASADLNPSVSNRPSPLVLRVYELRSDAAFGKADFISLYQGEQAALGGDLVAKDELMIQPNESRPYQRTLSAETRFLAVFGAYRNVERAVWRAIVAVPAARTLKLGIRAESQALSVTLQP